MKTSKVHLIVHYFFFPIIPMTAIRNSGSVRLIHFHI